MKKEFLQKLLSLGVQFEIINNNLKVNAPKGVLTNELLEEIKKNKAYLTNLITSSESIPKTKIKKGYNLTPTQYFMWFTHEHLGGNKAYNIVASLKLKGNLNKQLLEKAFQKVIERHEILRTAFKENNKGKVRQSILNKDSLKFKLEVVKSQNLSKKEVHAQIKERYDEAFSLKKDLLIKASLFSLEEKEHILLFVLHHIIGDGWSLEILTKEVMLVYNSLIQNKEIKLAELPIQYKDYGEWLTKKLKSSSYDKKLKYWKEQFKIPPPVLELTAQKRPAIKTYNGRVYYHEFSEDFSHQLKAFSKAHHTTLFMILLGGLNGIFSKYTGQTDITLGTTVAGREHQDLENQIGLYSNALPVRTQFNKENTFINFIQIQKQTLLNAYENKEYPFTKLVSHLSIPKDLSRAPLFDIMVLLQNHKDLGISDLDGVNDVEVSEYNEIERGVSQLDLSFSFVEKKEGISLNVEYNTDIYQETFIQNMLGHFETFLTAGFENPNAQIKNLSIITPQEKSSVLTKFNQPNTNYDPGCTILSIIELEARKNPNQNALIDQNEHITYKMLEAHSNALAALLEDQFKIAKGDFIIIELESSVWTIITIIAVLKLGAVYVPIDPNYPKVRKEYIKKDCKSKLTIDTNKLEKIKAQLHEYSTKPINKISSKDLAYVIYTSGTTGKPKGVQITHESFVDYALTFKSYFQLTPDDKVLQQASISFDTSIEEIFPILISGGTLAIHKDKLNLDTLIQLCEDHEITLLSTNPYVLQYLNQVYKQYNLKIRLLISGGDVLLSHYIDNLLKEMPIYNTYGPTESTVCATYHKITALEDNISIGKPIANRHVIIVDPDSTELTPIGIVGELCISGKGLSIGYLNHPKLTKEKFVENPHNPHTVMYRTGDLGYWKPNGEIVFLRRKDTQVKIRGYRIELDEITSVIQTKTAIKNAVVLSKELAEEKILVAYLEGRNIKIDDLKSILQEHLPNYMIPDFFVEVETIPLTVNGKINKKALLSIENLSTKRREYITPKNKLEFQIVKILEKILRIEQIGVTDSFFELGGHSLKALRLINELKNTGYSLKVKDIFMYPTIREMAKKIVPISNKKIKLAPQQEQYPVTSTQQRIWVLSQFEGSSKAYNISNVLALKGTLNISLLQKSIDLLIDRHESLRTFFKADESGMLNQYILQNKQAKCSIKVHQIATQNDIPKLIDKHINHVFNLTEAPLLKVEIITISEEHSLLLFNLHHIIGDGWSMELVSREVITLYNQLNQGSSEKLPSLPIQYKDFAYWKNSKSQQEKLVKSKEYWLQHLSGDVPILEFLTPKTRPKIKTYNGSQYKHLFSKDFTANLKKTTEQNNATLFMGLMAGLNGLLYRYSNQSDIILGTPISEREHSGLENQIGLYLNTLAIRTQFEPADTYESLLKKQKQVLLKSYAHQSYPFNDLVEQLNLKRNVTRSPLFDIMVVFHNQTDLFKESPHLHNIEVTPYGGLQKTTSQFDLTFSFVQKENNLIVEISYNTDIYTLDFVEKMAVHLEYFISRGIENPLDTISKIEYLSPKEKDKLVNKNNTTLANYSNNTTILNLIETQIKKSPEAVAILNKEKSITYNTLHNTYTNLAYYLLKKYAINPGDFVGIKLKRDEKLVSTIIAILKLGAVYVPIDMNYPQERIAYIEKDSACKIVITEELLQDFEKSNGDEFEGELPEIILNPDDLAYLIYTSGSTGKPKGVMITHANAVAFLNWSIREFSKTDFDVLYAATSHSFDLSIFEMFHPLCIGKKMRILTNSLSIVDYLEKDTKILINSVPSAIQNLLQRNVSLKNIKAINLAGEPLSTVLSNALQKYPVELRNLYGPSETTTYSSCYKIDKRHEQTIPIGQPIANTKIYILSNDLSLQGESIVGELYISGAGLSKGYLNKPKLTRKKFIPNPYMPNTKMYKTGDLAYWMPDGNIGFVGREDTQIKLRGYRIELGEIEKAVLKEKNVKAATVLLKEELDEKHIVAYIQGDNLKLQDIRANLHQKLPNYMIPTYYHILDKMPLTPNGKIDKKALLSVKDEAIKNTKYVAPKNDIEKNLIEVWAKNLKIEADTLGIEDNFFELGGNSLQAVILINNINKTYNTKLSITDLFEALTIKEVAELLNFSIHHTEETAIVEQHEKDELIL
ncbi:amino acid adenylation domain-containing protein [Kordia sp. YSTF-M3]|uniref:Amino acid adenylation domain-containing protein n=1 Tax=Kordia aestuariivivens TaxID=2759037 RepID=A0ABR7QE90_9FLAO|nr:non-ribosomal peptide synthetase [Kordia aestuariivivens]MBC8756864.1 amino acid adenylation domain-containing protein [Kordia aestuariivivens]